MAVHLFKLSKCLKGVFLLIQKEALFFSAVIVYDEEVNKIWREPIHGII